MLAATAQVGDQGPPLEQVVDDRLQDRLAVDEVEERTAGVAHVRALRPRGSAGDDERSTGEEHLTVTLKSDGDYPFFTAPRSMLKELTP